MEIRTVNTIVYCKKWMETVEFYTMRLKFPVTAEFDWFVEFKLNDMSRLSIADATRASMGSCDGKGITITMEVDDIDRARNSLKNAGLNPPAVRDHPWGAKVIYIYDPEGNRLEFWSQK
jgi:predicted enzyme related to lactoylglutathione lyase